MQQDGVIFEQPENNDEPIQGSSNTLKGRGQSISEAPRQPQKELFPPEEKKKKRREPIPIVIQEPPPADLAEAELEKEGAKKTESDKSKLDKLLQKSNNILFSLQSTFPFDLFPDRITIDSAQVHITSREFFKSQRIHSITIQDISDVFVETSPFFATLRIIDKDFIENSISIGYLKKDEAIKAKKVIQGLILGMKEGIDFSKVDDDKLVEKLEDLGSPAPIPEEENGTTS